MGNSNDEEDYNRRCDEYEQKVEEYNKKVSEFYNDVQAYNKEVKGRAIDFSLDVTSLFVPFLSTIKNLGEMALGKSIGTQKELSNDDKIQRAKDEIISNMSPCIGKGITCTSIINNIKETNKMKKEINDREKELIYESKILNEELEELLEEGEKFK